MDRRHCLTVVSGVSITALAGCMDTVEELAEGALGGDGGTINGGSETFEFEATDGDMIVVSISVRENGTGSGDLRLSSPDGVLEERGTLSLRSDTRFDRETDSDGSHELFVNAANAELNVSISVN